MNFTFLKGKTAECRLAYGPQGRAMKHVRNVARYRHQTAVINSSIPGHIRLTLKYTY